jgi:hypothetical protein
MRDDGFADDGSLDPVYTLVVKAETDRDALIALDSAHIAVSRFDVRQVPGRPERVLTVAFTFGDGSEWGHEVDEFRRPVEQRINEWFVRDKDDCREGIGFPMGSLLWWRRGGKLQ